jgi:inosine/xanthosine triphosphate pyrophosphatase family protein
MTFGEMPAKLKNSISHRAKALEKLKIELGKYIEKKV